MAAVFGSRAHETRMLSRHGVSAGLGGTKPLRSAVRAAAGGVISCGPTCGAYAATVTLSGNGAGVRS